MLLIISLVGTVLAAVAVTPLVMKAVRKHKEKERGFHQTLMSESEQRLHRFHSAQKKSITT